MLTIFLCAVCTFGINASAATAQADTLDKYIINDKKVVKFDGSQLVGKTVSDYKVTVTKSNVAGEVVRTHVIRTDGQKIKETVLSPTALYIVDGKKCDKEALNKIKPKDIASMTVYKAGSKEAVKLSGKNDVSVIEIVTK